MGGEPLSFLHWLALAERELLLFAGVFFLLGALDELVVDILWLWMRFTGRSTTLEMETGDLRHRRLTGDAALMIPAWREEKVIGATIAHALCAWPQAELRLYVGCYANDPGTVAAAIRSANGDPRLRIVLVDHPGPTTKADCLNRLYAAMQEDERRCGREMRMVLLHDAEDMVDPAALSLLDKAIEIADFVQLPVLPEPQPQSRWIGSHYCEEFAEAHGKSLVVRAALEGLPAAGVGCAFERRALAAVAARNPDGLPFDEESLTEDYELGLKIAAAGGRTRFLRVRGTDGRLVATRAYFPATIESAVRQKARWVHGIAFQGWDRMGWTAGLGETWMRLRDRRGPLAALVLSAGYLLLVLSTISAFAAVLGYAPAWKPDGLLLTLLWANLASIVWRCAMRYVFTAREYGVGEGLLAVMRIPVANVVAIMAGRRALFAYLRTLAGGPPLWDKTAHDVHPVLRRSMQASR